MKYAIRGVKSGQKLNSVEVSEGLVNVLRAGLFTKTSTAKSTLGWRNPIVHDLARTRGFIKLGLYKDNKLVSEQAVDPNA